MDSNAYENLETLYRKGRIKRAALGAEKLAHTANMAGEYETAARCHQMIAIIFAESGNAQLALEQYLTAEHVLLSASNYGLELLAQIRFQISNLFLSLGLDEKSEDYLDQARFAAIGTPFAQHIEFHDSLLHVQAEEDWAKRVAECKSQIGRLDLYVEQTPDSEVARINTLLRAKFGFQYVLWRDLIAFGADDEVEEGFLGAASAAVTWGSDEPTEFLRYADLLSEAINRRNVDVRYLVKDMVEVARKLARQAGGDSDFAGYVHYLSGLMAWHSGDSRAALDCALSAVSIFTTNLTTVDSIAIREGSTNRLAASYDMALIMAVDLGYHSISAELLETSRLQSMPPDRTLPLSGAPEGLDILLAASPANEHSNISAGGISRLGQLRKTGWRKSADIIKIESVIAAVGGEGAWWWATRITSGALYWCVRDPNGVFHSGYKALSHLEKVALVRMAGEYHAFGGDQYRIRSRVVESADALTIGQAVIPPVLVNAIAVDVNLSLVVSGNEVSLLALPSLRLDPQSDLRLVERSVIRIQPPAVIVRHIASQPASDQSAWPVLIACMDPESNLDNAYHADLSAAYVLCGSRWLHEGAHLASRDKIIETFEACGGSRGIFFYSGHSRDGSASHAVDAALRMSDGELTASDFLEVNRNSTGFRIPDRVLLSSCNSSGSGGSAAGQWLGLSAALLCGGARQVLATAWSIPDTEGTNEFEARLVTALQSTWDAAVALTLIQRDFLANWRASQGVLSSTRYPPIIWASFQCVGVLV